MVFVVSDMNGLQSINLELTSRCNKKCGMCGRRKRDREKADQIYGDMPFSMVKYIAGQVPPGIFVQFHINGEPLLYPKLPAALAAFKHCYTGLDTNGKLLLKRSKTLALLDTLTISIIQDDKEGQEQLETIAKYLKTVKKRPLIVFRILGNIDGEDDDRGLKYRVLAEEHGCVIVYRVLHSPDGSHDYEKPVTIPEIGVCLEMLHKLAIDRHGDVFPCVRYDPEGLNLLGNISNNLLTEIWHGAKRREWVNSHLAGEREAVPLCAGCDYYGLPRG